MKKINNRLYKELESLFPKSYYKFKKINILITSFLFIFVVLIFSFSNYFNNFNNYWIICLISILMLLFIPLFLVKININITIKKFKKNVYRHYKNKDILIKFNYNDLYKKRGSTKDKIVEQVYNELIKVI